MGVTVRKEEFIDRDQAVTIIEHKGLFARDGAMESGDLEDIHWHKTSLEIYVLSGSFETKDVESNQLLMARSGDCITIPSGTLHAARCPEPATYVVGFESMDAARNFKPEQPGDLADHDNV